MSEEPGKADWVAVWKQIDGLRKSNHRHKRRAALANARADEAEARIRELESTLNRIRIHATYVRNQLDSLNSSSALLLEKLEK